MIAADIELRRRWEATRSSSCFQADIAVMPATVMPMPAWAKIEAVDRARRDCAPDAGWCANGTCQSRVRWARIANDPAMIQMARPKPKAASAWAPNVATRIAAKPSPATIAGRHQLRQPLADRVPLPFQHRPDHHDDQQRDHHRNEGEIVKWRPDGDLVVARRLDRPADRTCR